MVYFQHWADVIPGKSNVVQILLVGNVLTEIIMIIRIDNREVFCNGDNKNNINNNYYYNDTKDNHDKMKMTENNKNDKTVMYSVEVMITGTKLIIKRETQSY